ncbi:LysR family transcriptional regulator [Pandoraea anapnoica]|uniref:LysR family transcriptional regulator n=1 Tax=Pandoraea anapnoica TaxID=2508301 RepID=A0A5E4ZFS9_9BURK|nr:LysR family transcriptional regulator [Pandoraea anapnoica]VVE59866.1 LysR family transcriptional regulator [Pandoraea anapnoica]
MELRALRGFVEVVRQQSFTAAAEALFVTQPTVSKMVKALEDELGTPLMLREERGMGRRLQLTDAGRVVFERGQDVLAAHARLQQELADLETVSRGELSIGIPPLGGDLFIPVIGAFHQHYPDIEMKLFETGSRAIEQALLAGEIELGAVLLPVDPTVLDVLPVCHYQLRLIAPRESRWEGRASVGLGELRDEPFVFYGEGFALSELVIAACQRAGFTPKIAGRSSQWDFIASMVDNGVGIALLPEPFCARLDPKRFVMTDVRDPEIPWDLAMAWRRDSYLSHAARRWLALARDILGPGGDGEAKAAIAGGARRK